MCASWRHCTVKGRLLKRKHYSRTQELTLRHIAIDFFSICVFLTHCPAVRCSVLFTFVALKIFPLLFTFGCLSEWFHNLYDLHGEKWITFYKVCSMFELWCSTLGIAYHLDLFIWGTNGHDLYISEKSHEVDSVFIQYLTMICFPSFKGQVMRSKSIYCQFK